MGKETKIEKNQRRYNPSTREKLGEGDVTMRIIAATVTSSAADDSRQHKILLKRICLCHDTA